MKWDRMEVEAKCAAGTDVWLNELGRRYDHKGNMTTWWSESLLKEFQVRADCFIKQYSAFTIDYINKKVSNLTHLNPSPLFAIPVQRKQ